jgi:predicted ribosomally synthesized peptide with nif11-like leader
MSEEQLSALLAKLKDDPGFQEKLKGAADLDDAVAIAKEAGFDVSKADWLKYQNNLTIELSEEELEAGVGGVTHEGDTESEMHCFTWWDHPKNKTINTGMCRVNSCWRCH